MSRVVGLGVVLMFVGITGAADPETGPELTSKLASQIGKQFNGIAESFRSVNLELEKLAQGEQDFKKRKPGGAPAHPQELKRQLQKLKALKKRTDDDLDPLVQWARNRAKDPPAVEATERKRLADDSEADQMALVQALDQAIQRVEAWILKGQVEWIAVQFIPKKFLPDAIRDPREADDRRGAKRDVDRAPAVVPPIQKPSKKAD